MDLRIRFSPQGRVNDIKAFFDSYTVDVWKDNLLCVRIPAHNCNMELPLPATELKFHAIDNRVNIRLSHYEPVLELDELSNTRWPFYVDYPLDVRLYLGDQFWVYKFSPGKTYTEREMGN